MSNFLEKEETRRLRVSKTLEAIELAEKKLELEGRADLTQVEFLINEGLKIITRGAWHLNVPVKGEILSPDDPSLDVIWEEDGRSREKVEVKKGHYQISSGGFIRVVGLYEGRETRALVLSRHPQLYLKAAREVAQTLQVCKKDPDAYFLTRWETYTTLHPRGSTSVSAT